MFLKITTAGFLLAAMLPTAADAHGIHVLSATYGTPQTGHVCDARDAIASTCNSQSQCVVDVRNVKLCGDPDFLVVKQVDISYRCGHVRYKTSASEYYLSTLACQ